MMLTPRETEKLLVYVAADLARKRQARGLKLNVPESVALIIEALLEGARDGKSVAEVMALGREVLTHEQVMDGVPELVTLVQVEATFPDGTKLVSCHDPHNLSIGLDRRKEEWKPDLDWISAGLKPVIDVESGLQSGRPGLGRIARTGNAIIFIGHGGMIVEESQNASRDEVLRQATEMDIRFVRLWFTDILGNLKGFAIKAEDLEDSIDHGVGFDGSAIEGFARYFENDMRAFPDPETFALLPWRPRQNAVARMFCDIRRPQGDPFAGDPRYVLERNLRSLAQLDFTYNVGTELEFSI